MPEHHLSQEEKALDDQVMVEQYIIQSEAEWAESTPAGDVSVSERILADDFLGTMPDGSLFGKAELVSSTREAPKTVKSNHMNRDSIKIRFFGDTAVVNGCEDGENHDGKRRHGVWTDVWVRRDGVWKIVAAHDHDIAAEAQA
jgi:hypothetical protein